MTPRAILSDHFFLLYGEYKTAETAADHLIRQLSEAGYVVTKADQPSGEVCVDKVVERNRSELLGRSKFGLIKYGVPLDLSGIDLRGFLVHAKEEAQDLSNYLTAAIMKLDGELPDKGKNS